ncbi:hypothetical protein HPB50_019078 [Hyalomma asiaticum]|uniref:Uncharacterized protein n=1 Tax=Hyalomma asiaticum TaxID=266040 RepID=A0ACB7RIU9_HYAAI|nr:hypothetical protein HPB50_019078 [Hyalomma asiaticum]
MAKSPGAEGVVLLWCCQWHGGACRAASTAHVSGPDRTTRSDDVSATRTSGSCQNEEVSECVSKLDLLSQNKSLAFATTEAELKRICSHLTGALDCVNAFTRRCFNEKQQEIYRKLTSGAAQLIEDFCREGSPFRLTYLKHSKCYKELQDDYNKCASIYVAQRAELQGQTLSPQDKIRNSCCQMDGYKQCAKAAVLRHCDAEAAELAEDIIVKAGGYLVTTHCSGYRIDEPSCSGCSTMAATALPAILTLMAWLTLRTQ